MESDDELTEDECYLARHSTAEILEVKRNSYTIANKQNLQKSSLL